MVNEYVYHFIFVYMSILRGLELLKDLSDSQKDNLSLFCQEKFLEPGEILFHEWDDANAMYILALGEIEVSNIIQSKSIKLWTVKAEEIIWEMAIFWDSKYRMATAEAKTQCVLITILDFSIKEITEKYPKLLEKIQKIIEERKINNKIIETEIKC